MGERPVESDGVGIRRFSDAFGQQLSARRQDDRFRLCSAAVDSDDVLQSVHLLSKF
jgi:hypothetical protein